MMAFDCGQSSNNVLRRRLDLIIPQHNTQEMYKEYISKVFQAGPSLHMRALAFQNPSNLAAFIYFACGGGPEVSYMVKEEQFPASVRSLSALPSTRLSLM